MKKIILTIVMVLLAYQHSFAAPKSLCPEKTLEVNTITATYIGTECGDLCYAKFKIESGEEVSIVADEDYVEKVFGKIENRFEVTYEIQQFWNEEINECLRVEVLKEGKSVATSSKTPSAGSAVETSDPHSKSRPFDMRGPNIKGFQLGMTLDEAIQRGKQAFSNSPNVLMEKTDDTYRFYDKNDTHSYDNTIILFRLSDKKVRKIFISDIGITYFFNAKEPRKGFIQAFIDKYGIPKLETKEKQNELLNMMLYWYEYTDVSNGWIIKINTSEYNEAGSLSLESIQKSSDFNF